MSTGIFCECMVQEKGWAGGLVGSPVAIFVCALFTGECHDIKEKSLFSDRVAVEPVGGPLWLWT